MNRTLSVIFLLFSLIYSSVNIESMSIISLSGKDDRDSVIVYDIGRPSLSADSELLSFEKNFNYETEKYEIYFNQYLSSEDNVKFHKKSGGKKKKKYYAENIMWPKYIDSYDGPFFYFFHKSTKKKQWSFEKAYIGYNENDEIEFDIWEDEKIYPDKPKFQRSLYPLEMNYTYIQDSWDDNENLYLIVTSNASVVPRKLIISPKNSEIDQFYSDYHSIFDSDDPDYNRNLVSRVNSNDLLTNPCEIQTKYTDDFDSQVLVNFKSQTNAQEYDVYYFCDINDEGNGFYDDNGYQIFPRVDSLGYKEDGIYYPFCNQFEPTFNFDGSKVAFLNQGVNLDINTSRSEPCAGERDIDLWVFDLKKHYESVCESEDDYKFKDDNSEGDYYLIDESIRNLFRFEQETDSKLSLARDYVWHPKKDILFYISEKRNAKDEIFWPISYYNFENCIEENDFSNCENGTLETHTLDNRHISISQDGQYLLFSFSKTKQESAINNNQPLSDMDGFLLDQINIPTVKDGECHNCHLYNKWKVAVAKIQIDE